MQIDYLTAGAGYNNPTDRIILHHHFHFGTMCIIGADLLQMFFRKMMARIESGMSSQSWQVILLIPGGAQVLSIASVQVIIHLDSMTKLISSRWFLR